MGDISEQAYSDKLKKVLDYTIEALKNKVNKNEAEEAAISFFQSMATEVAVTAGIIAALAFNPASGPFVLAGAWILAGYSAAVFIYDTVNMLIDLADIDLCDEAALQQMGNNLAGSVVDLGVDLLASATLGAVGRLSSAISDAAEYVGLSAWRLWRRLKERFGTDATNGGICSFDGNTLVITDSGYKPIKNIQSLHDRVWARDEHTGSMDWREVVAQYSNHYEETVHVTSVDDTGKRQTLTSNRIHPYFAKLAAGVILAASSVNAVPVMASPGHVYTGDIVGGAWVDAQYLAPGDELLGATGNWQTVVDVDIEDQPLQAFNLTVDEYSTYFVAGDEQADAVWVHNDCYVGRPDGFDDSSRVTDYGQQIIVNPDTGREVYRGHPPNDNNWYDIGGSPPTISPRGQELVDQFDNLSDNAQRTLLRDRLGGEPYDGLFAHHVIPLQISSVYPELMRKAAAGGFDMNGVDNGIMLTGADHVGGHPGYNADMIEAVAEIDLNGTPHEIAQELSDLADLYKTAIQNNTYGPWY